MRVDYCDAAPMTWKPVARIMNLHSRGQNEIPQGTYHPAVDLCESTVILILKSDVSAPYVFWVTLK